MFLKECIILIWIELEEYYWKIITDTALLNCIFRLYSFILLIYSISNSFY